MISDDIQGLLDGVPEELANQLDKVGEAMVKSMKDRLQQGDHIDTGQLYTSIHADTDAGKSDIHTDIFIDAKSPKNGAWYAEFLEFGTGIYNANGNGRQTPWAFQDRNGDWHTIRGIKADPFIRPSIAEHLGELEEGMTYAIGDLTRYKKRHGLGGLFRRKK